MYLFIVPIFGTYINRIIHRSLGDVFSEHHVFRFIHIDVCLCRSLIFLLSSHIVHMPYLCKVIRSFGEAAPCFLYSCFWDVCSWWPLWFVLCDCVFQISKLEKRRLRGLPRVIEIFYKAWWLLILCPRWGSNQRNGSSCPVRHLS